MLWAVVAAVVVFIGGMLFPSQAGFAHLLGRSMATLDGMKVAELHLMLIDALRPRLDGWKFVASLRHFEKRIDEKRWFLHLSFINHQADFDAVANVAVEYVRNRKRVCIVGASLGNIEGTGQKRFRVSNATDIPAAADGVVEQFRRVGIPFLERFSQPQEVISVLKAGGRDALLISPLKNKHETQIQSMERYVHAI